MMMDSLIRVAWRLHCQGDTQSYTADCFDQQPTEGAAPAEDDVQDEAVAYWTIVDVAAWLAALLPDWFI